MGSYTSVQQFYLIGEDDLVDVDQNLNYNLQRADDRMRPLVEYARTNSASITTDPALTREVGFKYYKTFSNAIFYGVNTFGTMAQDGNGIVPGWSTTGITFEPNYGSLDLSTNRISWAKYFNSWCRLRGALMFNNLSAFPKNVTTKFMTLPPVMYPAKSRYFFLQMGNGSGQAQTARVFIPAAGSADLRLEFCAYGPDGTTSDQRYISLNDIYYPINDAAGGGS